MSKDKDPTNYKIIAQNRKARFEYEILETIEAGVVLVGSEVKSLRQGKSNISEAFADDRQGAIYLINLNIEEYKGANRFNHEPKRPRKLLLHKKEQNKLLGAIQRQGVTLIPLVMYFNHKGVVKVSLGVGKGKKLYDKRATEKERDWQRDKARILKGE
ncbi:MAG: SsrA-binding protein [Alphaproteobacteria bacterium RIFCSPLOWO2_01_FULL_45_8]|nr:MAG: SsrA-binding protein [Alphaproteobacteria bacterium GWB1_45_5]OFW76126.1 MAG: SsrA-binding protein [Alphaproteobacteria bacterium GWA1_45_9]OFW89584.1 MAG: SsrA-binding protein [Alphaproteobacteria bacterium RIFCSPHIGHO2_01_FULL_41_14]OFW96069.1 MAG: SsrA-binding protein [Alphaproteobacteria bacterium RIFCSPLOWO2_01_FULL_45_8]